MKARRVRARRPRPRAPSRGRAHSAARDKGAYPAKARDERTRRPPDGRPPFHYLVVFDGVVEPVVPGAVDDPAVVSVVVLEAPGDVVVEVPPGVVAVTLPDAFIELDELEPGVVLEAELPGAEVSVLDVVVGEVVLEVP